jgi:hypothetical protein
VPEWAFVITVVLVLSVPLFWWMAREWAAGERRWAAYWEARRQELETDLAWRRLVDERLDRLEGR